MEAPTGSVEVETWRRVLAGDGCVSGVVKQKWRRFEGRDEDENKRGKLRGGKSAVTWCLVMSPREKSFRRDVTRTEEAESWNGVIISVHSMFAVWLAW